MLMYDNPPYDSFKSVNLESVKIKISSKSVKMIQIITFEEISENDTFESVILESKIKSARVNAHRHSHVLNTYEIKKKL